MKLRTFVASGALAGATALANAGVLFGTYDCGKWVNSPSPAARAWLLGYMSGINYAVSIKNSDPLDKVSSAEQIFLWMNNYCRANPLKNIAQGGNELYFELERK